MGKVKALQASTGTSAGTVTGIDGTATAKSADYTVTDTDNIKVILMTTGGSNRTVTLPTAADNTNREITIKKVDSGSGFCIIDGEGSELIDGATTKKLYSQWRFITLVCDGSAWHVTSSNTSFSLWTSYTPTGGWSGGNIVYYGKWRRNGNDMEIDLGIDCNGAPTGTNLTSVTLPSGFTINTSDLPITPSAGTYRIGIGTLLDSSAGNNYPLMATYASTTTFHIAYEDDSATGVITATVTQAAPVTIATGDKVYIRVRVPIAEFSES